MLTTENFQPPSTLPKKNSSLHLSHWSAGFMHIYIYIYIMRYNFFFPPFFYFITSLSLAGSMPCIYLWCNTIMYSHRHVASIFCESACPHYLLVPKGTPKLLVDTGTRIYFGWAHTKWAVGEIFMVAIKLYIYIYIHSNIDSIQLRMLH